MYIYIIIYIYTYYIDAIYVYVDTYAHIYLAVALYMFGCWSWHLAACRGAQPRFVQDEQSELDMHIGFVDGKRTWRDCQDLGFMALG